MTHFISEEGIARILGEESWVDHEYLDQLKKRSIGYGHLIRPGERFPVRLTKDEGRALFHRDLAGFETAVNRAITYPVTQRQYDVLVSLAFNIGGPRLERSELARKLNAGDIGSATLTPNGTVYRGAMLEWAEFRLGELDGKTVVLPVLIRRRAREIAVFLEEHAKRDVKPENAPDMRDPDLSETNFGSDDKPNT